MASNQVLDNSEPTERSLSAIIFSSIEKVTIQNCFSQILVIEIPDEITLKISSDPNRFYFVGINQVFIKSNKKSEHCRDGDLLTIFKYNPTTRHKQAMLTLDLFTCNEQRLQHSYTANYTNFISLEPELKKITILFEGNIDLDRLFDPIKIHLEVVIRAI